MAAGRQLWLCLGRSGGCGWWGQWHMLLRWRWWRMWGGCLFGCLLRRRYLAGLRQRGRHSPQAAALTAPPPAVQPAMMRTTHVGYNITQALRLSCSRNKQVFNTQRSTCTGRVLLSLMTSESRCMCCDAGPCGSSREASPLSRLVNPGTRMVSHVYVLSSRRACMHTILCAAHAVAHLPPWWRRSWIEGSRRCCM